MTEEDKKFMIRAIGLAREGMDTGAGGPFGAVLVKEGRIVAEGWNVVTSSNDPTAHAEITAIRRACENLNTFELNDCVLYTSCEPCPMCLGAIYWARIKKVYYALSRNDAANIGFDDQFIYEELDKKINNRHIPFENIARKEALPVFEQWIIKENRINY